MDLDICDDNDSFLRSIYFVESRWICMLRRYISVISNGLLFLILALLPIDLVLYMAFHTENVLLLLLVAILYVPYCGIIYHLNLEQDEWLIRSGYYGKN